MSAEPQLADILKFTRHLCFKKINIFYTFFGYLVLSFKTALSFHENPLYRFAGKLRSTKLSKVKEIALLPDMRIGKNLKN